MTTNSAAYMREYRKDPENLRRCREMQRATNRAREELARRYPDEYQQLYRRELAKIRNVPLT